MIDDDKKNTDDDDAIEFDEDELLDSSEEDEEDFDFGMGDDDDFEDFNDNGGNTLGDLWRNNPLVKVGVIFGVIVVIFGIMILFGGDDEEAQQSLVSGGSEIAATPGTEQASPAYREAIKESNEAEIERAFATGGSALPVPVDPPVGRVELTAPEPEVEEDPLARWRRLQEERMQRELEEQQNAPAQAVQEPDIFAQAPAQADAAQQALAEVMTQQMQSILQNKVVAQVSHVTISGADYLERKEQERLARLQQRLQAQGLGLNQNGQVVPNTPPVSDPILPAGEIAYAQLITEANSDTPGPVVALIAGGPLNKSRILGDFEVQGDLITLNFNTIVIDGQATSIEAVALDPKTTIPGMATEVDHRYLKRILLPAAAAFVEGTAEAVSEAGLTTITVDGGSAVESQGDADQDQEIAAGLKEAGREAREILDDIADDTKTLVRIASGTPMGILFLQGVYPPGTVGPNQAGANGAAAGQYGAGGFSFDDVSTITLP